MAPKRARASSSRAPPQIEQHPDYPTVIFSSEEQKAKFVTQTSRKVTPSRFLDLEILHNLGIYNDMHDICEFLSMDVLFTMNYNTHKALVFEFLSSLSKNEDDEGRPYLAFRLLNEDRVLYMLEFCHHFGLSPVDNFVHHHPVYGHDLWTKMSGDLVCNVSKMHISHVQHPVFRLFLKFLCNSVLGRPHNHQTRMTDVNVLAQYVHPNSMYNLYLPNAIWGHWLQNVSATSPIHFGGLITHLATLYGFADTEPVASNCFLSARFLRHAQDLVPDHDEGDISYYRWQIFPGSGRYVILPDHNLLDQVPLRNRAHYCLPGFVPAHLMVGQPEPPPQHHAPPPPQHHAPPSPPHYPAFDTLLQGQQQILAQLNTMSLHSTSIDGHLASLDQRVGRLESDQRAAVGPMYAYFDQQGYFSSMRVPVQPPSWYDPAHWGDFGPRDPGDDAHGGGDDDYDGDQDDD